MPRSRRHSGDHRPVWSVWIRASVTDIWMVQMSNVDEYTARMEVTAWERRCLAQDPLVPRPCLIRLMRGDVIKEERTFK